MTTVCMGVWSVSWTEDCPIVQTEERGMSSSISTSLLMMATRELTQGRLIMIITHSALSSNRYVLFSEFRLSSVIYSWLMGEEMQSWKLFVSKIFAGLSSARLSLWVLMFCTNLWLINSLTTLSTNIVNNTPWLLRTSPSTFLQNTS